MTVPPGSGDPMMLRRRRRATLRLYTSAVRRGVRVPKMLTMDERFEAIVADVALTPEAKMRPLHEQDPERGTPDGTEGAPEEREPAEEK